MLFNSLTYVIFLTIVFTVFWILKDRYRWVLLFIASYVFYMYSGPKYGLLIFCITCISYFSARIIENSQKINTRKLALTGTIIMCIGILFFFKYFNFFSNTLDNISSFLGINYDPIVLNVILPVGISFYTFQTMGYVIDVYRGKTRAEKHFGRYATFVSFFPQLVAGPIERSGNLLPQINAVHRFDYDKSIYGLKLMLWGYYKKLVIADELADYVQIVFDDPHGYTGFSLLLASLFFSIQIYCDFSGYSDIAIGTAKLFGIDLMTNFKSPYFSSSIREFWSRWHISLSTWFRDYVYIPLGGNRAGKARHYFNLMATFLISGFWHGANWTFIIWGAIHGIAQVSEDAFIGRREASGRLIRTIRMLIVFSFCVMAWVFFVSSSVGEAFYVISHAFIGIEDPIVYCHNGLSALNIGTKELITLSTSIIILIIYDYISLHNDFILWISSKGKLPQWVFYIIIGLIVVFFSKKGVAAEFIYFQF